MSPEDEKLLSVLEGKADAHSLSAAKRLRRLIAILEQIGEELNSKDDILVKHKVRGSIYNVSPFTVELQSSAGPVPEGTRLTIYMDIKSFKGYGRPTAEFNDGRFEKVLNEPPTE